MQNPQSGQNPASIEFKWQGYHKEYGSVGQCDKIRFCNLSSVDLWHSQKSSPRDTFDNFVKMMQAGQLSPSAITVRATFTSVGESRPMNDGWMGRWVPRRRTVVGDAARVGRASWANRRENEAANCDCMPDSNLGFNSVDRTLAARALRNQ